MVQAPYLPSIFFIELQIRKPNQISYFSKILLVIPGFWEKNLPNLQQKK